MKFKRLAGFLLSAVMIAASLNIGFADGTTNADTADVEATSANAADEDTANADSADDVLSADTVDVVNLNSTYGDAYPVEGGYIYYNTSGEIVDCDTSVTSADIPSEINGVAITSIGNDAFEDFSSLTSITIPDSVTYIGDYAFYGCESLTSITIPNSVTYIGDYAFFRCISLTSIELPSGLIYMGINAFGGCSSLTSIELPSGLIYMGINAFEGCSSLTSVTIPDGIRSIDEQAFSGCTSLTSVTIPDSVTFIGIKAFEGCTSLTSITIPDSVTYIDVAAFYDCENLTVYCYRNSYADNTRLYPDGTVIVYISDGEETTESSTETTTAATESSTEATTATAENSTEATTEASTEASTETTTQQSSSSGNAGILIKFDHNNGITTIQAGIKKGSTLTEPTEPTYDGYIFTGWYTDKECTELYDFTSTVTSAFTLYAGWKADNEENTATETTTTTEAITETTTVRHTGGGGGSSSSVSATTTATTTEAATEETTEGDAEETTEAATNVVESDAEATTASVISNEVRIVINSNFVIVGDNSYTMDAAPYIQASSNSTLVPLRFVAIAILGDDIENADDSSIIGWNAATKTASITANGNVIQFTANSNIMNINGNSVSMDNGVKAEITDGRMYIPFRALGNALGVDVDWDSNTKTAIYKTM